jgi:hypothetical protein
VHSIDQFEAGCLPHNAHAMTEVTATTMDVEQSATMPTIEEPRPPRTHVDSKPLPTDSMVTVPLSEAGTNDDDVRESIVRPGIIVEERRLSSRPSSDEIHKAFGRRASQASVTAPTSGSPTVSISDVDAPERPKSTRSRSGSESSGDAKVDWAELEKKETQQSHEGQDDVGTTLCWQVQDANTCSPWHCSSHALSRRTTP